MENRLMRPVWERLPAEERRELLEQMGKRHGMLLLGEETFSRWGQTIHTACFRRAGGEFVFVPGDTVTLGWESFVQGMDEENLAQLREEMENLGWEGTVEEFLGEQTTPVRQVTIGPMLVERTLQAIGYEEVPLDDPRLTARPDWLEDLARAERENCQGLTISGQVRFLKGETGWQAELYHEISFPQLKEQLAGQGFSLPTTDQWEYLCGGGCRTFFPWGDSLDLDFRLLYFGELEDSRPYDMKEPNFFGLSMAYDPYRLELTVDPDGSLVHKGGDGGCNLCGGAGPVVGFLPCAPYFRYEEWRDGEELDDDYDFYRRVLEIRED